MDKDHMYEVFDSFLNVDTWHTRHVYDNERFYRALADVVKDPEFSPDTMREYMRESKGLAADDHDSTFASVIDRRTQDAWAVKDFLKYTQ